MKSQNLLFLLSIQFHLFLNEQSFHKNFAISGINWKTTNRRHSLVHQNAKTHISIFRRVNFSTPRVLFFGQSAAQFHFEGIQTKFFRFLSQRISHLFEIILPSFGRSGSSRTSQIFFGRRNLRLFLIFDHFGHRRIIASQGKKIFVQFAQFSELLTSFQCGRKLRSFS